MQMYCTTVIDNDRFKYQTFFKPPLSINNAVQKTQRSAVPTLRTVVCMRQQARVLGMLSGMLNSCLYIIIVIALRTKLTVVSPAAMPRRFRHCAFMTCLVEATIPCSWPQNTENTINTNEHSWESTRGKWPKETTITKAGTTQQTRQAAATAGFISPRLAKTRSTELCYLTGPLQTLSWHQISFCSPWIFRKNQEEKILRPAEEGGIPTNWAVPKQWW